MQIMFKRNQWPFHIETSQLIWSANQLPGFYMRGTLVVKGLKTVFQVLILQIDN